MPSKKKKKKKKPEKPQEVEFELNFSDPTMVESDGLFDRVKELLEKSLNQTVWTGRFRPHFHKVVDSPSDQEWNITSDITIESPFGAGRMEVNLRSDKSVHITDYSPSTSNIYYNPDLSALMRWTQVNGWKIPQPSPALIRSNLTFWRYMWETLIIDSDYLDERYGMRKSLDMRDSPKTEMELAEEREMEEGP